MTRIPSTRFAAASLVLLPALVPLALAQDRPGSTQGGPTGQNQGQNQGQAAGQGQGQGQGQQGQAPGGSLVDTRAAMWPAPTAEDWKKPCLIRWQRTLEDATAVSHATGRPILVCVNMDGEIASEHYAGVRYRQPEIAKLYEPYVNVIASVYRHTPRDYDDEGRRIECPRFGTVTCGEHIAIEPLLYGKYFEGQRVAPRHIGIELDGKEMYDVFYAWDTDTIFNAVRTGVEGRKFPDRPSSDRPAAERVASPDSADRDAIEAAYLSGTAEVRRTLLAAIRRNCANTQPDLLRLALRGLDLELARAARQVLIDCASEPLLDLIAEALRAPMEAGERDALIAALERLGASSPRARSIAHVQKGMSARSERVDEGRWSSALVGGEAPPPPERSQLVDRLTALSEYAAKSPDAAAKLEMAEASLALFHEVQGSFAVPKGVDAEREIAPLMLEDALQAALKAEELGATGWRVHAAVAIASYRLGDAEQAHRRAEAAMAEMPSDAEGWNAMAVLAIFAQARQMAIEKAVREQREWPAQWLADATAAYSVLARHPYGTEDQVAAHYDLLARLGAGQAPRVLEEGLARFPEAWKLHDRLRGRILQDKGLDGLETEYEKRLREPNAHASLEWYAGFASLWTAEFRKREGRDEEAFGAYSRAIAHYTASIASYPASVDSSQRFIARCLAGRAWIESERGQLGAAVDDLVTALELEPDAAATLDGLNRSPVTIARLVLARLGAPEQRELAQRLEAALNRLDPALLAPPEFDREARRPRR
jgi:hypothetical protein